MGKTDTSGDWPCQASGASPQPAPAERARRALRGWIAEHPSESAAGGVRVLDETVTIYWKGTVPRGLRRLAVRQRVPVSFQPARYSRAELVATATAVMLDSNGMVSAAGGTPDCSAISVLLSATAPPNALARIKATSSIPILLRGIGDPKPLGNPSDEAGDHA